MPSGEGSSAEGRARARVTLRVEGGLAHIPGLARPRTVDSDELDEEDRAGLMDVLGAAGLLPGTVAAAPPPPAPSRGADRQTYTVTVECSGEQREVTVSDPVGDEPYGALVRTVRRLSRRRRGG